MVDDVTDAAISLSDNAGLNAIWMLSGRYFNFDTRNTYRVKKHKRCLIKSNLPHKNDTPCALLHTNAFNLEDLNACIRNGETQ